MSRCHARACGFQGCEAAIVSHRDQGRNFLTFPFISARFGRFGGFVSVVSVVSLVSVVSFRPFRFVVSGFSTCLPNVCCLRFQIRQRRVKKQAFIFRNEQNPVPYIASRERTVRLVENMGYNSQ